MINLSDLSDAALLRFVGPPRPPHEYATCKQDPDTGLWQAHHPKTLPRGGPKMPTCREALLAAIEITNPGESGRSTSSTKTSSSSSAEIGRSTRRFNF